MANLKLHQKTCAAKATGKELDTAPSAPAAVATPNKTTPTDKALATRQAEVVANKFSDDLTKLAERKTVAEKVAFKKSLIPDYLPRVQKYVAEGLNYANTLLVYMALWLLDADDIEQGLPLAILAVEQGQDSPPKIQANLATTYARCVVAWAAEQINQGHSAGPYINQVADLVTSGAWQIEQKIVLGEVYAYAGKSADLNGDKLEAVEYFEKAMAANDKAGVKTRMKLLKKELGQAV